MTNVLVNGDFESGETGWSFSSAGYTPTAWSAGVAVDDGLATYNMASRKIPTAGGANFFYCSDKAGGTTSSTEPTWASAPNPGNTVAETNGVEWTNAGTIALVHAIDATVYAPGGSTQSLRISGGCGFISKSFNVQADKRYKITAKFKITSNFAVHNYGNVRAMMGMTWQVTNATAALDDGHGCYFNDSPIRTQDWFTVNLGDYTYWSDGGAGVDQLVTLYIDFYIGDGSQIWIDDIVADEVDIEGYGDYVRPQTVFNNDADFKCWSEAAQAIVLKTDTIAGTPPANPTVSLKCLPGEKARFQVVVEPAIEWTPVTWTWDSFDSLGDITIMRPVLYVNNVNDPINDWNMAQLPYGDIPDPLPPDTTSTLAAGDCFPFFFIVSVPYAAAAGTYTANLYLKLNNVTQCTIPVELTVAGQAIPVEPTFLTWAPINETEAALFETIDDDARVRFCNFLLDCRCRYGTVPAYYTEWTGTPPDYMIIHGDQVATTGTADPLWAAYAAAGRKPVVSGSFNIIPGGTYGTQLNLGGHFVEMFTDASCTEMTADAQLYLGKLIDLIVAATQAQGCTSDGFFLQLFDEPNIHDANAFGVQDVVADFVRGHNSEVELLTAVATCDANWVNGHGTLFYNQLSLWMWQDMVASIKATRTCGHYNIYGGNRKQSPLSYRLYIWALWNNGFYGQLWNELNSCANLGGTPKSPWTNNDDQIHESHLFYPPRGGGNETQGPVSSLRWEGIAQAMCDVELFHRLSDLIAVAPEGANRTTAQDALDRVSEAVTHAPQIYGCGVYLTYNSDPFTTDRFYSMDLGLLDDVNRTPIPSIRSDVIDAIVLLESEAAPHSPRFEVNGVENIGKIYGGNAGKIYGVAQ